MTDLTPEFLARLRVLAELASPGTRYRETPRAVDEVYIANVSPPTIIGLLDELERLRTSLEQARAREGPR